MARADSVLDSAVLSSLAFGGDFSRQCSAGGDGNLASGLVSGAKDEAAPGPSIAEDGGESLQAQDKSHSYETRNMIMLSLYFTVYFGFRSGCLIVLPLSCKMLLVDWLDGEEFSPFYQFPLALWFCMDVVIAAPNAIFMNRYGRRAGFLVGSVCAFVASISAFLTLRFVQHKLVAFVLLNLSIALMSVIGMAEYVKYAAAEACADDARRGKAVSRVITGGAILSIASPFTSSFAAQINSSDELRGYAYYFLIMSGLAFVAICASWSLRLPPVSQVNTKCSTPLSVMFARTDVWSSVFVQVVVQFIMVTPMSGTPLGMVNHLGLPSSSLWISGCIVSHVLSMFLPGLFTGHFIGAVGKYPVMCLGIGLQLLCMVVMLLGYSVLNFYVSLIILGVGWNFAFVSSTILLLSSHTQEERPKVTAVNETLRFLANAIASILSSTLKWDDLSYTCLGLGGLLVAIALIKLVLPSRAS